MLLTSLPLAIIDASEVVFSYFQRWPSQELQFRYKKSAVALNHVAGYGRREIENPKVVEAQKKQVFEYKGSGHIGGKIGRQGIAGFRGHFMGIQIHLQGHRLAFAASQNQAI